MAAKRLSFPILTATAIGALGSWASAGALAVLDSHGSTARIGILPSAGWLLVATAAAVAVVAAFRSPTRLSVLALAGLGLLPWLPTAVPPALLIWTRPLMAWVWLAIGAAAMLPWIAAAAPGALRRLATDPRRAPACAAALAACLYLLAAFSVSPQLPTGDEPHYLVITQSLLLDHDLKIENNHRRGDYHAYYGGDLRPDYLRRGTDEQIYSIHAPGLSVIVAPAFTLFGYPGVVVLLALFSAAATGVAWAAVWGTTGDAAASWFGWAAVALSVPFFFQSFIVYPDALGGAIVMAGVVTMLGGADVSERRLFATGAALAVLPWLHTRFAIAAASLALLILARNTDGGRFLRRAAALLAVPVVSAVAWFGFFYAIYGVADPRAPYGGYTQSELGNLTRGIPGLLFDQQFGLLPNAPVYLCAFAGFGTLARRAPRFAIELAVIVVPYSLAVAAYFMWWGGFSSAARFLTPVLLPLAIPSGVWFRSTGRAGRVLALAALTLSLAITATIAIVDRGALLYNSRDGASKLLLWLSPLVNLTTGMPSLFQTTAARALVDAAVWAAAVVVVVVAVWASDRRRSSATGTALLAGVAAALGGMAALTLSWRVNAASPLTPQRAALALLATYDVDARQIALSVSPFERLARRDLPSRLTIADLAASSIRSREPGEPLIVLHDVPPAVYEIDADVAGAPSGHVAVTVDRTFGPLWSWDLSGPRGFMRRTVMLPVPLRAAIVDMDPAARAAVDRLVVKPVRGLTSDETLATTRPEHVTRYGSAIVFLLEGQAYLEPPGAWVGGGASATFAIMRETAGPLQLFVRNPPVANQVQVESGSWRQDLILEPGAERLIGLPLSPDRLGTTVRVTSTAGATPATYERGSTDQRFLGCWIEVR